MFESKLPAVPYQSDNVEADGLVAVVFFDETIGGFHHAAHFGFSYEIFGVAELCGDSCFHFYEDQEIGRFGNNINLESLIPPVSLYDSIPFRTEISHCLLFSFSAQFVVFGHFLSIMLLKAQIYAIIFSFVLKYFVFFAIAKSDALFLSEDREDASMQIGYARNMIRACVSYDVFEDKSFYS